MSEASFCDVAGLIGDAHLVDVVVVEAELSVANGLLELASF